MGADGPKIVARRLEILTDEFGLERERLRLWGVAHAVAWGFSGEGRAYPGHVRAAEILHELGKG